MTSIRSIAAFTIVGAFATLGCVSTTPPQDLLTARSAYDRANHGPAATLKPADMHVAKQQLDLAEASFQKDGDTQHTRDEAYLATRKTQLAETLARTQQSKAATAGVVGEMHAEQTQAVAHTSAELGRTKSALAAQNVALVAQGAALADAQR